MAKNEIHCNSAAGSLYGLGVIGAATYYISAVTSFREGVLGTIKALVWSCPSGLWFT